MSEEYIRKADAVDAVEFGITLVSAINIETGERTELFQRENDELREAAKRIKDIEPADVVQVVHGKWKYKGVCGIENNIAIRRYKCSECREDIVCDYPYNFCPNCGAKMDAR